LIASAIHSRGEALYDRLIDLPVHEAFRFVPGVPHARPAIQIAGVGGLDVDLAETVGYG
jgi:hypothetical protein